MPTYDKDGHLYGDAYFNAEYFHVGNEAAEKTYINMENEELEIHNLVEPTEDNDAATKKYVDDIAGGGGGGGDVVKIVYDDTTMSDEDLGVAVKAVIDAGKIPAIEQDGTFFYLSSSTSEEGYFSVLFTKLSVSLDSGMMTAAVITGIMLDYSEGDGWYLDAGHGYITLGSL